MNDKIFSRNEVVYGIPSAEVHGYLLDILRIEGFTVHKVMDNNDFNEYPHIHNAGPYIGGTKSNPGESYYIWVPYSEFLQRLYDHVTRKPAPVEQDWREKLSDLFNEKIKSYAKEDQSDVGHQEVGSMQSQDSY